MDATSLILLRIVHPRNEKEEKLENVLSYVPLLTRRSDFIERFIAVLTDSVRILVDDLVCKNYPIQGNY